MIENYFSTPIGFYDLKSFSKIVDSFFEKFLDSELQNKWQPDNDTAQTSFVPGEKNDILSEELKSIILAKAEKYLIETGQDIIVNSLKVDNSWINLFKKGQLIGYHDHGYQPNVISGVYYLKAPKGCGKIIFKSSNPYSVSFPNLSSRYPNVINCEVEDGMLILFPSWLLHKVEPNNINDERISIAFNISFDYSFYRNNYES